jgi:hypothetical protein
MSEIERVARAIGGLWFDGEPESVVSNYPGQTEKFRERFRAQARAAIAVIRKPVYRVKMGKQRLNSAGLKMFDPVQVSAPWLFEQPKLIHEALK